MQLLPGAGDTRASSSLRQAAEAITPIREIASSVGGAPGSSGAPGEDMCDALEEVGAWGRVALHEPLSSPAFDGWLRAVAEVGLPEPVLTNTGAAHLEVPWTNYIFRALGGEPLAYEAHGNCLAEALFCKATHTPAGPAGVRVFRELPLGLHKCPKCHEGAHACSLDIALVGTTAAVGIEHKVRSPPSDFEYRPCGHPGSQSVAYKELFGTWCGGAEVSPFFVWLSPGGAGRDGWYTMTHAKLAETLAPRLKELGTRGERYRAAAFVLDLASGVVSDFSATLRLASAYRRAPQDDSLAAQLTARLNQASHHTVMQGILDALV
jgi:hypothetical protein